MVLGTKSRHRTTLLLLLAVCLTTSTGCVGHLRNWCRNGFKVGPDYCKPAAPVACDWIDGYDDQIRQELTDNPAWWTVFNDPILNGLIEDTYRQNLPLRVAGMRVVEARRQRQIADRHANKRLVSDKSLCSTWLCSA